MQRTARCRTGKPQYTHVQAERELLKALGDPRRPPLRSYPCPFCHWRHLTHQPPLDVP